MHWVFLLRDIICLSICTSLLLCPSGVFYSLIIFSLDFEHLLISVIYLYHKQEFFSSIISFHCVFHMCNRAWIVNWHARPSSSLFCTLFITISCANHCHFQQNDLQLSPGSPVFLVSQHCLNILPILVFPFLLP